MSPGNARAVEEGYRKFIRDAVMPHLGTAPAKATYLETALDILWEYDGLSLYEMAVNTWNSGNRDLCESELADDARLTALARGGGVREREGRPQPTPSRPGASLIRNPTPRRFLTVLEGLRGRRVDVFPMVGHELRGISRCRQWQTSEESVSGTERGLAVRYQAAALTVGGMAPEWLEDCRFRNDSIYENVPDPGTLHNRV